MKWIALLGIAACTPKVPPHLAIDPPKPVQDDRPAVDDLESAIDALVRKDPLARAPTFPEVDELAAVEGGGPLVDYVERVAQLERGQGQVERELLQLEDTRAGTAVVALSRGYRLRLVENMLATTETLDETSQRRVVALLTPLQDASQDDTLPRGPLEWIDGEGPLAERVRRMGDRWVLAAWLDAPGIPLAPVGKSLQSPIYDGLIQTPTGKLVMARATRAEADPTAGLADLREATRLALIRAAADRDSEQAAWSEMRTAAVEQVGSEDPIETLLARSASQLTEAASSDAATGGALLGLAGLRWLDACSDPPCIGLDRTLWMKTAGQWDDAIRPLASAWRVLALKEALDQMDVGHETVLFPQAAIALADALLGTGAGPLDLSLLRRRAPSGQVWLELARAVGTEGATDWPETRTALGGHLARQARIALEQNEGTELAEPLERIAARAIP